MELQDEIVSSLEVKKVVKQKNDKTLNHVVRATVKFMVRQFEKHGRHYKDQAAWLKWAWRITDG